MISRLCFILILSLGISCAYAQGVIAYKAFHDKGRMLVLEGKYDAAVAAFDSAIQIMPYYSTIFQDRGYAHLQLSNYTACVSDFNRVLQEKPYLHEVRLRRGIAFFNLGELEKAEQDLHAVIEAEPLKTEKARQYLSYIQSAKQKRRSATQAEAERIRLERERQERARARERVIWGTAVPLAFWTSVFILW